MEQRIQCVDDACDFEVEGDDEDELLEKIKEHEREQHGHTPDEGELRERLESA